MSRDPNALLVLVLSTNSQQTTAPNLTGTPPGSLVRAHLWSPTTQKKHKFKLLFLQPIIHFSFFSFILFTLIVLLK